MATGLSYRRISEYPEYPQQSENEQSSSTAVAGASANLKVQQAPKQRTYAIHQTKAESNEASSNVQASCGPLRSVQFSLSGLFKKGGKTINIDEKPEAPISGTTRQPTRVDHIELDNKPSNRRQPTEGRMYVKNIYRQPRGGQATSGQTFYHWFPHQPGTIGLRKYLVPTKTIELSNTDTVFPSTKRKYPGERFEHTSWVDLRPTSVGNRSVPGPRAHSSPLLPPNSILKRQIHHQNGSKSMESLDGNVTNKQTCFNQQVDVFYFRPNDRLQSTRPVSAGALDRRRRESKAKLEKAVVSSAKYGSKRVTSGVCEPKWTMDITRHPVDDDSSDVTLIRLKVKVNCKYIRERTSVKALSGGQSVVITIFQNESTGDGATVERKFAKKLSLPLTIDPYRVKAHVHKDGLLTIDAPVIRMDLSKTF